MSIFPPANNVECRERNERDPLSSSVIGQFTDVSRRDFIAGPCYRILNGQLTQQDGDTSYRKPRNDILSDTGKQY
ncbi:hypothetical protein TNCV_3839831 [Trichonephila clavipes]|nr:hypothetical protein TNCV_3839831 [Trichonephila clavipes]